VAGLAKMEGTSMHSLIKLASIVGLAAAVTAAIITVKDHPRRRLDETQLVNIEAGELSYYPAGDYFLGGDPVSPPLSKERFDRDFQIMKRQVSQAEYAACVSDGACKPLDKAQRGMVAPDLPAVGVSWRDATAYAAWLSARTRLHYRLPTYAEWVYAAGSAYKEDVVVDTSDSNDPAQRWLLEYKLETQRKAAVDAAPKPFNSFGTNSTGLSEIGGNVWDWTDSCHTRQHVDQADASATNSRANCGIRVVAGKHRSYISDFVRDPKSGACSVGVPPSNLGFRLVRDTAGKRANAA
jgi:formylglycine-generating enzyme required for sulfatase activity